MNCFFSIIIPTYNSSKHIYNSLKSIVSQTFKNYEILIIDGASKDDTLKVISTFNDERIFVTSENDKGIYDAMNKGILKAKGDWLYFLGSDDELYDNNVLSDIYLLANKTNEKVIYGNVKLNGSTGWGQDGQVYNGEFNIERILDINIAHQAIFYHKEVFRKCGLYNIKYKICADHDYNLNVAANFNLRYVDMIIAYFNAGGASTNIKDLNFEKDYSKNVIGYFMKVIYQYTFIKFEKEIFRLSINRFRDFKIINAFYLLIIGFYFKIIKRIK